MMWLEKAYTYLHCFLSGKEILVDRFSFSEIKVLEYSGQIFQDRYLGGWDKICSNFDTVAMLETCTSWCELSILPGDPIETLPDEDNQGV